MRWKVVFLAVLLVSAVAVMTGVAITKLDVVNVIDRGFPRAANPKSGPLEAIDDESPPG